MPEKDNTHRVPQHLSLGVKKPEELGDSSIYQLKRLLRLRRDHEDELNADGLKLVDKAITSALIECIDAGRNDQAIEILNSISPNNEGILGTVTIGDQIPPQEK